MNITWDFSGRSVIVTGAARGVGLAIAQRFQEANAEVFMVDFDAAELEDAAQTIGALGVAAVQDHSGAGVRQAAGQGQADTAYRTCDECQTTVEAEVCEHVNLPVLDL